MLSLFSLTVLNRKDQSKWIYTELNEDPYSQESSLKKRLKTKNKKKPVKVKEGKRDQEDAEDREEEEEGDGNEGEQENCGHREKASSALIPPKKGKTKHKTKVKEETVDVPESPDNDNKEFKGWIYLLMAYIFSL